MLSLFTFLTGLLLGIIGGMLLASFSLLSNGYVREYFDKAAFDNYYIDDEIES